MSSKPSENRTRDQSNDNQQQQPTASQQPNQPPAPPPPAPPHGYPAPSTMPMAYPANGQAPYPGYPPPQGYNQYPYTQAPPGGGYYYTQAYASPRQDACSGFARGIILALFIVILFTFLSSLLTLAILRPRIPVFNMDNMIVSNFNTDSSTPFTANWDATLTIENINHKLRLYLDKIQATIYYEDEDALASTWIQPVYMEKLTNFTLNVNISSYGFAEEAVPIWITQEMDKDRAEGSVNFALRLRILATMKSDSWWTKSLIMRVYCEDLKILFKGNSENGVLAPRSVGECEVYA